MTPAEMMAKVVSPIDVPNCAIVLNTAPARPCVLGVNASVIMRFATVKITIYGLSVDSQMARRKKAYHLPREDQAA